MKKELLFATLLLSGLLACRKEAFQQQAESGSMTIYVGIEQAKAELADAEDGYKKVLFQAGDAISVFANGKNYKFETAEGGLPAAFTGSAPQIEGTYYVASPYKKAFTIDGENRMHVVIPQEQKATPGSADPKAFVCAAAFRGDEMVFLKNAVSLLKVTVPSGQQYKKIEVACAAKGSAGTKPALNQTIAGDIILDENGDITLGENRSTSVRLVPAKNQTTIPAGDYYIAVRPGTYKVTIAFVTEDDRFYVRRSTVDNTLEKSHIIPTGTLSTETFTDETAPALLTTGANVNIALKQLVNDAVSAVTTDDNTITAIHVETLSLGGCLPDAKVISSGTSAHPVYARLSGTEVTLMTSGSSLELNEASAGIFRNFKALKTVDFASFSDEKVTNMTRAFAQSGFTSLDLSSFVGDKVTTINYMFENCTDLLDVNLCNFSGKALTDGSLAFSGCASLQRLNLESVQTDKVTNFKGFVLGCSSLSECRLSMFFTASGVTDDANLSNMWYRGSAPEVCELWMTQETYDDLAVARANKSNFVADHYQVNFITPGIMILSGDPAVLIRGRKGTVRFKVVPGNLQNVNISLEPSVNFTSSVASTANAGEYVITLEDAMNAFEYKESVCLTASYDGGEFTRDLTVESSPVNVLGTGLPIVILDTPDAVEILDKENWIAGAALTILNPDFSVSYSGALSVKGRGNNTWLHAKKPYALKLDKKSEILGMKTHKRWCLLANYVDRTLLRNDVAFEISRKTSLAYTPSGKFVELVLNGEHKGNYYLCEQIKQDANRVNISSPKSGVGDGGYIVELDDYFDEMFKFRTARKNLPCQFKDPDEVDEVQFNFLRDYINNMEEALYDETRFANREFADYMDLQSFVDYYFVIELTQNNEANVPKSVYMHRNVGGKMTAGPVWDFDYATFIKDPLMYLSNPELRRTGYNFMYQNPENGHYYGRLMQDKNFKILMKERWEALRADLATIPAYIEQQAELIRASESVNHAMWPIDTRDTGHDETLSFDEAVTRLKEAYQGKFEFMDTQISGWHF